MLCLEGTQSFIIINHLNNKTKMVKDSRNGGKFWEKFEKCDEQSFCVA